MSYCIDTSAIITAWNKNYPIDVFPTLWSNLDNLIDTGKMCAPDEVLKELEKKDDEVLKWAKRNNKMFSSLEEDIQKIASEILIQFPNLIDENSTSPSFADPFIIALAKYKGITVVTEEKFTTSPTRVKIPNVCAHFSVPCINLLDMVKELRWRF